MSKTKAIELSEPLKDHRGVIKKIVLREPKYSDFISWDADHVGFSGRRWRRIFAGDAVRSWGVDRAHRLAAPPKHGRPCNSIMSWRKP
jgi:hypothetical protein